MPHFPGGSGPREPSPDEPGAQRFVDAGRVWTAVRRHEMTALTRLTRPTRGAGLASAHERRLVLFFFGDDGEVRRAIAPSELADPAPIETLRRLLADATP